MKNFFTAHPERATNTGHELTPSELWSLANFVSNLLVDDPQETLVRVEALWSLVTELGQQGIPEAMTLGDLLYMASNKGTQAVSEVGA